MKKRKRANTQGDQVGPASADKSLWQDPFVHLVLIVAAGFALYCTTVSVPFVFDDYSCLVQNPVIKSFRCFPDTSRVFDLSVNPDLKNNLILRPVAYFTFALNYRLHGLNLFGYHLVNIWLHIGSALLLYYLVGLTLKTPALSAGETGRGNEDTHCLPLFTALLFLCHPLQTQAVTYIIQRFVPLATFFYLAALALYVQSRLASLPRPRLIAYLLSLAAAVLAMESKEIAFTLPAVMVLFEAIFFSGKPAARFARLVPFLLTMAIIPLKLLQLPSPAKQPEKISGAMNLVNFSGVSWWDYLITQFGVIATYLRLLFLPVGQNLDYDYPLQQSFFKPEVLLPLALLLAILATGIYLLKRSGTNPFYKIIAFGIFWFFITLSVESSIVPIDDLIFEHRVYLPSVGFFMALLAGVAVLTKRFLGESTASPRTATFLLAAVVLTLSAATVARNSLWRDEVGFRRDVVSKSPNKARTHIGLGAALLRQAEVDMGSFLEGKVLRTDRHQQYLEEAVTAYKEAIRLSPKVAESYVKLAQALVMQKRFDEAISSLATAIKLEPASSSPYVVRGDVFQEEGDAVQARQEYLQAIKNEPSDPFAHMKLADLYTKEGDIESARRELEFVMQVYPDDQAREKLAKLKGS